MPAASDLTRDVLDTLARAWLTSARGFGVWQGESLIAWWPRESPPETPDLEAPLDGLGDGWRIGVCGVSDNLSRARLEADAALAVRLTRSSSELDLLTEQLIERQDQLLALYELVRSARSTLDLPVTLQNLSRDISRLLRAERGFLAFDPGPADPDPSDPALTSLGLAPDEPRPPSTLVAIDGETISGHSEEAVAVNSLIPRLRITKREFVVSNTPAGAALGHRHLLAAPVRVRDVVAAVLGAARSDEPFASADVKLARAIAEQAGAQIENALLHEDRVAQVRLQAEMQLAVRVQSDLLPQTWPQTPGLEFFATSKPASLVGGDFYDVVPTYDRDFFVCLGDVSGKGLPAALVMSMTHAALRVAVRGTYRAAPDLVLKTTVASLYDDFTRLEMFATAFLARYAHEHRVLHYVNAGHAPVLYRPRGGPAVLLSADAPPLGMLPDAEGVVAQILGLRAGDLLVVATDGLNEARAPSGEQFGYERLLALIDRVCDAPAPLIARALLDAVFAFQAGRTQDDDQSLIVLKGVVG